MIGLCLFERQQGPRFLVAVRPFLAVFVQLLVSVKPSSDSILELSMLTNTHHGNEVERGQEYPGVVNADRYPSLATEFSWPFSCAFRDLKNQKTKSRVNLKFLCFDFLPMDCLF